MWTDTIQAQDARADLAFPTDLADGEWAVLCGSFRCLAVWHTRENGRCAR